MIKIQSQLLIKSNNQKDYKFKNAIIATGSVPISLPNIRN
jgi:pyruvate/2-oxoglutarate dehydrogenase complex dihydrolipoamide dehydrogenase (E3) component